MQTVKLKQFQPRGQLFSWRLKAVYTLEEVVWMRTFFFILYTGTVLGLFLWFVLTQVEVVRYPVSHLHEVDSSKAPLQEAVVPQEAQDIAAGQKYIQVKVENDLEPIQPPVEGSSSHIWEYITASYPNSSIDQTYFNLLQSACTDIETLERVIAIGVAECGLDGTRCQKTNNLWGYFYGGDKNYDPSREEMAQRICNGIGRYYRGVESNVKMADRYTGSDRTATWLGNVNTALSKMRALKEER